ncbi:MAG: ATP-binding protein [Desulfobacterales bacterium]|nr:MAG: ATP-binding protein [Desulfobacterales bacterium]
MNDYEKLGAFYLGQAYDLASQKRRGDLILYDSKDLSTHAVIIGMTGSGKTGLGLALLEEALIDNIPVIAIDPKGDLANLLLNFPELRPEDFMPWVNVQDALSQGLKPEQFAGQEAAAWRQGLAAWGQGPDRIGRLRAAADFAVFTPGSNAGLPVSVLRNFAPPAAEVQQDVDLFRERIQTSVTGLLALLGIDADPLTSREHILIANIFETHWAAGQALDLAGLIRAIQQPPFTRIGVMDLDAFYPAQERFALALRLNNLLAAPGFEAWLEGSPLDIEGMLHTEQGKPRALIFSIAHLSDPERIFFVSTLLNEIIGWMRRQTGTSSLRAILYMDEIYGYFPPVQNPPTKAPMLTLLKQARAYGLGVVLSTQNPVDLDYKGLANTGTWFIGRLQTERDKQRVLEGLEGAAAGTAFDRRQMEAILAGLGKRVFLLHNVHESEPVIFETRWLLSYLRGPMTREEIKQLSAAGINREPSRGPSAPPVIPPSAPTGAAAPPPAGFSESPLNPAGVKVFYLPASGAGLGLIYYPAVAGWIDVHYADANLQVDVTEKAALAARLEEGPLPLDWDRAVEIDFEPSDLEAAPLAGAQFGDLPAAARQNSSYQTWSRDLLRWTRQQRCLVLYRSERFKMTSQWGESEGGFRARLAQMARERRDLEVEQLRRKYSGQFTTLQNRLMRVEQVVAREQEQAKSRKMETAISFGTAILGAFLGRKAVSARSVSGVGTAMKSAGRLQKEKMDVARAQETAEAVRQQMAALEQRLQADIAKLDDAYDPSSEVLKEVRVKSKSSDMTLEVFGLVWMPYRKDARGQANPDWS